MSHSTENFEKDNELADFTDRLLNSKLDDIGSNADDELVGLKKTILRLNHAIPPDSLEDARAKQILVQVKARARREKADQAPQPSFWRRLFDFQANPQVGLLMAVVAVLVVAIVSLPLIQTPGSAIAGTAFSDSGLFPAMAAVVAILFVLYWISRRK